MRIRPAAIAIAIAASAAGAVAMIRQNHRVATARAADGGVLMGDVAAYDRMSRWFLGSLFRGIAADVAGAVPPAGRVLEVGCGPGLLSIRLAGSHGLDVTGLDLDPEMIERARANAAGVADFAALSFVAGDVAALPFEDAAFDAVVSTMSMHHWPDRAAALGEIARVLRPGGRVLIWDLKPGILPFHPKTHREHEAMAGLALHPAGISDWRWPGPLVLTQRFELERD